MDGAVHSLRGVYPFSGAGLSRPVPLDDSLTWRVPAGCAASVASFRGGNSSDELVLVLLVRAGVPLRYFPIGARGDVHVALRAGEVLAEGEQVQVAVAAPEGASGEVVVDLCLVATAAGAAPLPAA